MSKEHTKRLCIIPLCKNERFDLVHKFPTDNQRAEEWRRAINLPEINNMPLDLLRKRTICSKHFRKEDYKNIESRSLNKTAIPTLNFRKDKIIDNAIIGDITEKCQDQNVIETTSVGGNGSMGCRNVMRHMTSPVRLASNNNSLATINARLKIAEKDKDLLKYVCSTDDTTTTTICEEGPSSKYRFVQSIQSIFSRETQLESIPGTELYDSRYLESLAPVTAVPNIDESIALIDPSTIHLNFLTTNNTVDIVQSDHTYVNEITQQLTTSFICKYLSPLLIAILKQSYNKQINHFKRKILIVPSLRN